MSKDSTALLFIAVESVAYIYIAMSYQNKITGKT